MPDPTAPVLVAGASGTTGGAVVAALRARGARIRALSRDESRARALDGDGVEGVVGDPADPASLGAALDGVRAAYIVNPAAPGVEEVEGRFARAAREAGVELLVKLSVIGAGPDAPIEFGRIHGAAEEAIRATGIGATMLRPNGFMQNTLQWAGQLPGGVMRAPVADARWSIVDVRDIGEVAATALLDPAAHAGRNHVITGPEPLSTREEVAILGEVLGRELAVQEVPISAAQEALRGFGVPDDTARRLGELWELYAAGGAEGVAPDVGEVLGRPPRDFRTFASDHAAAFGG